MTISHRFLFAVCFEQPTNREKVPSSEMQSSRHSLGTGLQYYSYLKKKMLKIWNEYIHNKRESVIYRKFFPRILSEKYSFLIYELLNADIMISYFSDRASSYNSGKWPTWRTMALFTRIQIYVWFVHLLLRVPQHGRHIYIYLFKNVINKINITTSELVITLHQHQNFHPIPHNKQDVYVHLYTNIDLTL
jgi:hypothetical protein